MDIRGKTFWEMEKESISYARKNESVWINKAVIAATVTALEDNERELDLAFKAQDENDPGGYVAQKNQQFEEFFRRIFKLGRKLSYYAMNSKNKILLKDVSISKSQLLKLPEKEALIKCNTMIKRGNEYLSATVEYDVTEAELEMLANDLLLLEKAKPSIGVVVNDRKSAGRSVKELMKEARSLLITLDNGFEGLIDDENFIEGWFAIRKIKGRHKVGPKDDNGKPSSEN